MVNRSIEGDGDSSTYADVPVPSLRRPRSPVYFGPRRPDSALDESSGFGFGTFVPSTPEAGIER